MTVAAVVPAAGRGERLGAAAPKALVPVGEVAMVTRAVAGLVSSDAVDAVVVAAPPGCEQDVRDALGGVAADQADVAVVTGAADRVGSVAAALEHLPSPATAVLVHDAARCLCPATVVRAVAGAVRRGPPAVIPALPLADTVKRADDAHRVTATVDRTGLVGVQTPQGFEVGTLRRAHARAADARRAGRDVSATDDAGLVEELGETVVTVPGDPRAFKITTALDLAMAEALVVTGPG